MKKLVILVCMVLLTHCSQAPNSLKQKFADDFLVGVALGHYFPDIQEINDLVLQQFNVLTPENQMKFGPIHPEPEKWQWEPMDNLVEFAQENDLKVVGHALAWHNQTPDWVFKNEAGELVSPEILEQRMQEHITAVVSRYKGKVFAYDVVNEAIQDPQDGDGQYRPSYYYQILGKDFLVKAFEIAHAADPDAELYYNDYNMADPQKREKAVKLLQYLQSQNVRLDAVGMQAHWNLYDPPLQEIEKSILAYSELGLKVMITELDVSLYKWGDERDIYQTMPDSIVHMQTERYKELFQLFEKHSDKISRVTFWGPDDGHSWLNDFPVQGRTNHVLLFDRQYQPKPAYFEILKL